MRFLKLLPVLLILAGCGSDPPSIAEQKSALTFVSCPSALLPWAYWGFGCYPSNNECIFGEYRFQYIVNGRLIERNWYHDSSGQHGGDFFHSWCFDTSPWPTSWGGPMEVYNLGSDYYTLYAWKKEGASNPSYPFAGCHCYTSTNGFSWSTRTCYGWECD